ncbi:hypothetical protein EHI8A_034990 [Entamoeba histolytica HM-1:IMSS-B]|uniref:Uncharacterized protein n=6 Tax=Entamoeba histolytica TaxID=5759 RepID=C4M5A9_ENTH1|nr:hypothetical protein EHI_081240 [Entamoeba histolytica HM-1:IMSS]EMD48618.1 Hypothetical protein EHI5A_060500 [Entamoeba histolytica KU27]EMH74589.1 hypothetical protein EHI8A_034990 [Entamoeba histolytica HM-1:IMSS-B]EMS15360.1 hypothetical protein KM1_074900 [Entamoeba histolytica HM-3:IMSS]ENY65131.1 hypothetical protein EHI7A_036450 [Entamoeba histolytica HM-1:IMSS-A]GAT96594.1 hypothetical protein CL6EHI_081240 [Entamoeba histolytica]|eukprot:XP_656811.1 hypothetical protein EHI_081240 [Entamoeba histolytica HM-1:IMSS]
MEGIVSRHKSSKKKGSSSKMTHTKPFLFGVKHYKDFYAIQQGVLIALANQCFGITLKKPRKNAKLTQVFPRVKTLHLKDENVEIIDFTNMVCHPLFEKQCENVKKIQTAQRRFEKNKKVFMQNLLIDILLEFGFFFDSKMARHSQKTFRLERIQRVFYKGIEILNIDNFISKGNRVNDYLCGLFSSDIQITLQRNDPSLLSVFGISIN